MQVRQVMSAESALASGRGIGAEEKGASSQVYRIQVLIGALDLEAHHSVFRHEAFLR